MSDYRHPLTGHGEGCLCPNCDEVPVTIGRSEYERLLKAASGNILRLLYIADDLSNAIVNEPARGVQYPVAVYGMAVEFRKELKRETRLPPLFTPPDFYMMRDAVWNVSKRTVNLYATEPWRFAVDNPI